MSDQRRQRLESVLRPLLTLDDFSSTEAKHHCGESTPAYVTLTLGQLVREGVLHESSVDDEIRFRWSATKSDFQPSEWIDQQIHGVQITEIPKHLRPRERLLRDGVGSLSEADLLAILIRVGVRNESAIVGAQKIANRFALQLEDLPKSSPTELKKISPAATQASFTQIMAGIELGRRIARLDAARITESVKITSTGEAIDYCRIAFSRLACDAVQEEFHIVTLDTKHKPIYPHRITVGTLDASLVHPREVFRPAIRDSASAILLVHNHPSGDPTPSPEDFKVTDHLTEAGKLLGITILDHIIVARNGCVSIRESS